MKREVAYIKPNHARLRQRVLVPGTPPAGHSIIYALGGLYYSKDDAGDVERVSNGLGFQEPGGSPIVGHTLQLAGGQQPNPSGADVARVRVRSSLRKMAIGQSVMSGGGFAFDGYPVASNYLGLAFQIESDDTIYTMFSSTNPTPQVIGVDMSPTFYWRAEYNPYFAFHWRAKAAFFPNLARPPYVWSACLTTPTTPTLDVTNPILGAGNQGFGFRVNPGASGDICYFTSNGSAMTVVYSGLTLPVNAISNWNFAAWLENGVAARFQINDEAPVSIATTLPGTGVGMGLVHVGRTNLTSSGLMMGIARAHVEYD